MSTKKTTERSIEEILGSLPDGGRVVPFFVSAHDREVFHTHQGVNIGTTSGIYIGKAYLLKRISTPYTQKMNADFDVQRWSVLIIKLAPISDRAIDNTLGLKEYHIVECWIAEKDLPKVLLFDAKQKDLFSQVPDDPTDDPAKSKAGKKKKKTDAKQLEIMANSSQKKDKPKRVRKERKPTAKQVEYRKLVAEGKTATAQKAAQKATSGKTTSRASGASAPH